MLKCTRLIYVHLAGTAHYPAGFGADSGDSEEMQSWMAALKDVSFVKAIEKVTFIKSALAHPFFTNSVPDCGSLLGCFRLDTGSLLLAGHWKPSAFTSAFTSAFASPLFEQPMWCRGPGTYNGIRMCLHACI